jgi:hexosaminidase
MVESLRARGLQTGTWEEAVMVFEQGGDWYPNADYVGQAVYPYIWNSLWGNQDLGYRLANAGYPVILCNVTNFYFDLAYNKDPREPGLYWAGFVDTEDAFSFVPYDLFQSLPADQMGRPFDPALDFEGMVRLTAAGRENIAGLQAQMWSETIKGRQMFEYYYLPKLYGFAQRAWQGQADWAGLGREARLSDYNRFLNTVSQVELPFAESFRGGYHFRIPPPGMLSEGGTVTMNAEYPGYVIRYTTDGSEPGTDSPRYSEPLAVPTGTTVRAACFSQSGRHGFISSLIIE